MPVLHEISKIKSMFPTASDHWIVNSFDTIHNLPNQTNELGNTFFILPRTKSFMILEIVYRFLNIKEVQSSFRDYFDLVKNQFGCFSCPGHWSLSLYGIPFNS